MASVTKETVKTRKFDTPKVSGRKAIQGYRRSIRTYEQRYETSSVEMLSKVSSGEVRETAEILKWMQAYHALQSLEDATRTVGTHTTTTAPSTKSA